MKVKEAAALNRIPMELGIWYQVYVTKNHYLVYHEAGVDKPHGCISGLGKFLKFPVDVSPFIRLNSGDTPVLDISIRKGGTFGMKKFYDSVILEPAVIDNELRFIYRDLYGHEVEVKNA